MPNTRLRLAQSAEIVEIRQGDENPSVPTDLDESRVLRLRKHARLSAADRDALAGGLAKTLGSN
jgi:hypothetical protein